MPRGAQPVYWGKVEKIGKVVSNKNIVVPPEEVYELARIGCTVKEIADFFGVQTKILYRHFDEELKRGTAELKQKLRKSMLENALVKGNVIMQIYLSKNILGMSDNGYTDSTEVLPWTDDMDDDPIDTDVEIIEQQEEVNE